MSVHETGSIRCPDCGALRWYKVVHDLGPNKAENARDYMIVWERGCQCFKKKPAREVKP